MKTWYGVHRLAWLAGAAVVVSGCGSLSPFAEPLEWPSFPLHRTQEPAAPVSPAIAPHVIADFNRPGHRTNDDLSYGAWNSDPGDPTQSCRVRLVDTERVGPEGFGLLIDYDVESPNPAYNGFWLKLPEVPLAAFGALSFSIKGDAQRGFTRRLRLELKDRSHVAGFQLEGITAEWTQVQVPLRAFAGIEALRRATEFVIVFDDETVTEKVGTVYLDNLTFEPTE
ncbi:MAG: hypothetical protein Q8R78_06900 [Candidatus Omnitrophota bacterium]|nr:hypothetical protein [Candidatus Omnitrophota bacterium]